MMKFVCFWVGNKLLEGVLINQFFLSDLKHLSVIGYVLFAFENSPFFNFKSKDWTSSLFASLKLISYLGSSCLYNLLFHIELAGIFP